MAATPPMVEKMLADTEVRLNVDYLPTRLRWTHWLRR